jgi:hypothetical protein
VSRPRERHITGHCERCGAAHDVLLPRRGSRDLGLTHVPGAFRFCVRCGRYVGRSCCWQPTAVACADCAHADSGVTALPGGTLGIGSLGEKALGHMRSAVTELVELVESLEAGAEAGRPGHHWIDAWTTAGLLDARIQSARDAIAKRIWDPSAGSRAEAVDLDIQVRRLSALRDEAMELVESGLLARREAARRVAAPVSARRAAWTGLAVAVLVAGITGVASGGWSDLISAGASPSATHNAGPTASENVASPIASPPSVVASPSGLVAVGEWTFDDLRMGPIEDEPDMVAEGNVEVVAVPTAIDRSVAMPPEPGAMICVASSGIVSSSGALLADVYVNRDVGRDSALALTLVSGIDATYQLTLRADELSRGGEGAWVRARWSWSELPRFEVEAALREGGETVMRAASSASSVEDSARGAACFSHQGDAGTGEILLDNIRLEGTS